MQRQLKRTRQNRKDKVIQLSPGAGLSMILGRLRSPCIIWRFLCGKELTYQTIRAQSTGHRSRRTWILQFCEACAGQARRTISLPQIWRAAGSATYRCRYINILTPPRQRRRVRKHSRLWLCCSPMGWPVQ